MERLAKGSSVILLGGIAAAAISYILRIYLARNLSLAQFGLFYAVLAFLSFFGLFKDMGIGQALAKMIPEFQARRAFHKLKSVIAFSLLVQILTGLLISSVLFVFSDLIAVNFFHDINASNVIKILSIEFFIGFPVLRFALQGFQKIKAFAFVEPSRLAIIFAIVIITGTLSAAGVALAFLIEAIIMNIVLFIYIGKLYFSYPKSHLDFSVAKETVKFGLILLAGGIAGAFVTYTDVLTITFFRPIEEVALYQVALPTSQLLWVFAAALGGILLPITSEMWAKKETEKLGKGVSLLIKIGFAFMVPLAAIMISFPEAVLTVLFGARYISASIALQILSIAAIFFTIYSLLFITLIGIGKPWITAKITFFMAFLNLLLNIILVPLIGIIGAAFSTLFVYALAVILSYKNIHKEVKIHTDLISIEKIFLGGILVVLIVYGIKGALIINPILEAIVSVLISIFIYSLFILKTKTITKNDIEVLSKTKIPVPNFLARMIVRFLGE